MSGDTESKQTGRIRLFWVALGLTALPSYVIGEGLIDVYTLAEKNDPRYNAARFNYAAVQQRLPQARAALWPTLRAGAEKNRNDVETVTDAFSFSNPPGRARFGSSAYSFNLSQPLYNGEIGAGLDQADAEVRQAEAEHAAAQFELMLRVTEAYFGLLAADDELNLVIAEKNALAHYVEVTQARLNAGLGSVTDVHDATARYAAAEAQEVEAGNRRDDLKQALNEITGQAIDIPLPLREQFPLLTPDPPDAQQWVLAAWRQNPELRASAAAADRAKHEIERLRARHRPTLDAVGTRTRTDADASIPGPGVRADNTVIGLRLSVPLFQGGLVNAQVAEAANRYAAALQEQEAKRRATERAARAAYAGVNGAKARVGALRQVLSAGENALQGKSEGFKAGIHTAQDLLDAQRDWFRARRDYTQARHAYVINRLRLKQAAGMLSENDMVEINGWLRAGHEK